MAIEIEKKYRLTAEQREQILTKLKELGASFSHEDFEVNDLYGGGVLEAEQAVLRVRKMEVKTILTYKKRIEDTSSIKQQIEYETEVADGEEIEKIITSLGFKKALIYEKRRQTWHLRNVEVLMDELPFGLFMEIEGGQSEILEAEKLLKIENLPAVMETYPLLTAQHGEKRGEMIEARFK